MCECAVGLSHLVSIFALFDGIAAVICSIEKLTGQTRCHGCLPALARAVDNPADGQSLTAIGAHLNRYLICSPPNTTRAHLKVRAHIIQRIMEYLGWLYAYFGLNLVKCAIDDLFSDRALAIKHQARHE